jgi:hypothetical protein
VAKTVATNNSVELSNACTTFLPGYGEVHGTANATEIALKIVDLYLRRVCGLVGGFTRRVREAARFQAADIVKEVEGARPRLKKLHSIRESLCHRLAIVGQGSNAVV